jgi:hypothetical protein
LPAQRRSATAVERAGDHLGNQFGDTRGVATGNALAQTELKIIIRVTGQTWPRCAATGMWDRRGEVSTYVSSATGQHASHLSASIKLAA